MKTVEMMATLINAAHYKFGGGECPIEDLEKIDIGLLLMHLHEIVERITAAQFAWILGVYHREYIQ